MTPQEKIKPELQETIDQVLRNNQREKSDLQN